MASSCGTKYLFLGTMGSWVASSFGINEAKSVSSISGDVFIPGIGKDCVKSDPVRLILSLLTGRFLFTTCLLWIFDRDGIGPVGSSQAGIIITQIHIIN